MPGTTANKACLKIGFFHHFKFDGNGFQMLTFVIG